MTLSVVASSKIITQRLSNISLHSDRYTINCGAPDCIQPVTTGMSVLRAAIWELDKNVHEPIAGPANMHESCVFRWEQRAHVQAAVDRLATRQPLTVAEVLDRDATWRDYASNLDDLAKQLGPNDLILVRPARKTSSHRTPVLVWKVEL